MFRRVLLLMTMALAALSLVPVAEAGSLKAQVYLVQVPIPTKLTEKALLGFGRAHANKILRETTEADLKTRKWKAEMIVSFNACALMGSRPLNGSSSITRSGS